MDWNSLFLCCLLRERIFFVEFKVFFAQILKLSPLSSDKFSLLRAQLKDLTDAYAGTTVD